MHWVGSHRTGLGHVAVRKENQAVGDQSGPVAFREAGKRHARLINCERRTLLDPEIEGLGQLNRPGGVKRGLHTCDLDPFPLLAMIRVKGLACNEQRVEATSQHYPGGLWEAKETWRLE